MVLQEAEEKQPARTKGAGRPRGLPNNRPSIPGWHDDHESARLLGEDIQTRRRNRRMGIGPKWVRHGRHILYRDGAEEEYLAEKLAKTEPERAPPRRGRPQGRR